MEEKRRVKPYEIGELDQYLLGQGNHYEIYKKLGAHLLKMAIKRVHILQCGHRTHRKYLSLASLMTGI